MATRSRFELLKPYCDVVERLNETVAEAERIVKQDTRIRQEKMLRPADDGLPSYAQTTGHSHQSSIYKRYLKELAEAEQENLRSKRYWKCLRAAWEADGSLDVAAIGPSRHVAPTDPFAQTDKDPKLALPTRDLPRCKDVSAEAHRVLRDDATATCGHAGGKSALHSRPARSTVRKSPCSIPADKSARFSEPPPPPKYQYEGDSHANGALNLHDEGPSSPLATFRAAAILDFDAEKDGDLSFKAGQIVVVVATVDQHWFRGLYTTFAGTKGTLHAGIFPKTYVVRLLR